MQTRIAVFCTPEPSHFRLLRPLIAGLAPRADVCVFTTQRYEAEVRESGATFFDLFGRYSLDSADRTSMPVPSRYVTYAAVFAEQVAQEVARFAPSLIVYETFSLIGPVVARLLQLPAVNLSPGHDLEPARLIGELERSPFVRTAPECLLAVDVLRERYGLTDASPFSYATSLSRDLNIYCEPPTFLPPERRQIFEPLAFFGSLPGAAEPTRRPPTVPEYFTDPQRTRVFVSFGTIVWRVYPVEAIGILKGIARGLAAMPGVDALISLGHAEIGDAERKALTRANVRVEAYVDQQAVLREADCFVTHHGINSTHEAIAVGVPMVSVPFFWDQPALAATCQRMGIAVPIGNVLRGPVTTEMVQSALDEISRDAPSRRAALQSARDQELEVIAGRPAVFDRILELARV